MLILKLFIPMSLPGLAALGVGATEVATGTFNVIEISAIVVGLLVVAVAGIFTIRSNVAKIWREQAEGEKALNAILTAEKKKLTDDLTISRSRTDLTALLELLGTQHREILVRLDLIDAHVGTAK